MLSASWIYLSFLIGLIGFALFLYGKKEGRLPFLTVGIALMVYPYFVKSTLLMLLLLGAFLGLLWLASSLGG